MAARAALQQRRGPPPHPPLPGVAIWHWDLATGAVEWDDGLDPLFGYSERVTDAAWHRNLIHPGDRDRVETSLQRATLRNDGHAWSERYRLRQADGSYTLVVERAYVLRDEAGPCVVVGAITRKGRAPAHDLVGRGAAPPHDREDPRGPPPDRVP